MLRPGWTAVIVNYNGAAHLVACLDALGRTSTSPTEIVVVDNASDDDSLQELHAFPRVDVRAQPRNLGFAGGANVGLAAVETDYALLLNPDVEIAREFGTRLLDAFAADERLGAAGALLTYPDSDVVQHAGGVIQYPTMTTTHRLYGQHISAVPDEPADVDFVTGGAMGLRTRAFRDTGGFDEQFSPVYYEDVDLCVRLRAGGWRVRILPELRAAHHEGVTLERGGAYHRHLHRNRLRFALKQLSARDWHAAFVPAEVERLRHELHTLTGEDWPLHSGADAIEALARGVDGRVEACWNARSLIANPPPAVLEGRINHARNLAAIARETPSASTFGARLRGALRRAAGTLARSDASRDPQQRFNEAIVHVLEAQDAVNREQTALTLLLALDLAGQLQITRRETAVLPAE
jgi:GT2 family glycosyltransferase